MKILTSILESIPKFKLIKQEAEEHIKLLKELQNEKIKALGPNKISLDSVTVHKRGFDDLRISKIPDIENLTLRSIQSRNKFKCFKIQIVSKTDSQHFLNLLTTPKI